MHNHGWAHFTESPADLAGAFATLRIADRLKTLEMGEAGAVCAVL
jgi:hypothetical protein